MVHHAGDQVAEEGEPVELGAVGPGQRGKKATSQRGPGSGEGVMSGVQVHFAQLFCGFHGLLQLFLQQIQDATGQSRSKECLIGFEVRAMSIYGFQFPKHLGRYTVPEEVAQCQQVGTMTPSTSVKAW